MNAGGSQFLAGLRQQRAADRSSAFAMAEGKNLLGMTLIPIFAERDEKALADLRQTADKLRSTMVVAVARVVSKNYRCWRSPAND